MKNRCAGQIFVESLLAIIVLLVLFLGTTRLITTVHIHIGARDIWQSLVILYHNKSRADISDINLTTDKSARHRHIQRNIQENDGFEITTESVDVIDQDQRTTRFLIFPKEVHNEIPAFSQRVVLR